MATLPRPSKVIPTSAPDRFQRPVSDFDAGLNTSAAWTEHIVNDADSLSDEEVDCDIEDGFRTARALYNFEGKVQFRELEVKAGDDLEIFKEELAEGWSLARTYNGQIGLLPRSYYTFTSEFAHAHDLVLPPPVHSDRPSSKESITPNGSPKPTPLPILPQNTGEWLHAFPSFRRSLLGGKSFNRFSSFVTSGAEEFILKGPPADAVITRPAEHSRNDTNATIDEEEVSRFNRLGFGEADQHFVDTGPAWKDKIPLFRVLVHSPSKRNSYLTGAFIVYNVTSLFQPVATRDNEVIQVESDSVIEPPLASSRITVYRRFSHFVVLHTALTRRLPGIALPPLPEKQYSGRFNADFVEARRGDLERYIGKVVRHPVARYAEILTFFLSCENDDEWDRQIPQYLTMPAAGPTFYTRVFHPAFNLDIDEAQEAVDRFEAHIKAVGKGVQGVRDIFGLVRESCVEMSKSERLLAYSLLSLITSKPLASAPTTGFDGDVQYNIKSKELMNEDGAWCWRENCEGCLKLTKAMQKTSETLQSIAYLYDDHARRRQLITHESLKGMAHPSLIYEPIITTHKSALSRYREANRDGEINEEVASRCETVLNTTMAEMETYHAQKLEDFSNLTKEHLDGDIELYEQILTRLYAARSAFDSPAYDELANSPCKPSIYERELESPRLTVQPLPQPCPHVFDSTPMRPVSVAVQEGVGFFLGSDSRGSVFSKLWRA